MIRHTLPRYAFFINILRSAVYSMARKEQSSRAHAVLFSSYLSLTHKVKIYVEYHNVCPLVRIGNPPHPVSPQRVCPPPLNQMWGGTHSPTGEGVGCSQFGRLEKKPSTLSTLWLTYVPPPPPNPQLSLFSFLTSIFVFFLSAKLMAEGGGGQSQIRRQQNNVGLFTPTLHLILLSTYCAEAGLRKYSKRNLVESSVNPV